jgi:hydroxybutyrate-dimer hydrolase
MPALIRVTLAAVATLAVAGCTKNDEDKNLNSLPDFVKSSIVSNTYDGNGDDLLTAGLGKTGLAGAAPAVADAANPTPAELRRIAIYNNYRALVDMSPAGGYGTLYGPNVDANGNVTASEGKVAGEEHLAYADDGSGRQNVTMMVQIPSTFTVANACIVTATSSGSRGVYGAIATAGEWGLKHGCAVAYTDKGTGTGGHDLANNAVYVMQGTRTAAGTAGTASQFTANLSASELAAFNAAFPNRWAYKHAHSQQNPEKDWGRDTLRAVEFAFYVLNQKFGTTDAGSIRKVLFKDNTLVIASSVSNGGGAAIAALEQDGDGLIDGLAVGEPQINLNPPSGLTIKRGAVTVPSFGHTLYDYFTLANLYQPCASIAPAVANVSAGIAAVKPNPAAAMNRCSSLAAAGLVTGASPDEQSTDALDKLLAAGWEADSIPFQASHYSLATLSVAYTYATAFAKAGVADNLCGYSFGGAPVAGVPLQLSPAAAAQLFGTGNGVPPTSGINIINNNSVGGAALDAISVSPGTAGQDLNAPGALCLRALFTGTDAVAGRVRASIDETKRNGDLRGRPAVIVHGRSDTLVPVNQTSRPYYALNKSREGGSKLAYYEVTNAQHFDAFIDNAALPGYDSRLVPLHVYVNRALDIVYANLRNGTAIPPSQVIRTTPRGGTPGAAPAITPANVPPIPATPAAADAITFSNNTLTIPE